MSSKLLVLALQYPVTASHDQKLARTEKRIPMKVILFGATGMVGQGVLRECLLDSDVEFVLTVVRSPTGQQHAKLREIVHQDFFDFSSIEQDLSGYDVCFFCLGVSSAGMSEEQYRRLTYDLTLAVAQTLVRLDPGMTFLYISGAGTDTSERGRSMWARVKGQTENALLRLPFRAAFMLRPGYIQPLRGIRSKTKFYRVFYAAVAPLYPLWEFLLPKYVTTTERVARAMLAIAKNGYPKRILENSDIKAIR
jgi:uncharacterized protein YbjT (DUF2867 family)